MEIKGAHTLVTGATGGIGQAIARAMSKRGAELVLTGRRADVLEPLAAATGARTIPVDLSRADEVGRLVQETGEVDILIANAALPGTGWLDDLEMDQIDRALNVNLRAPIALAHEFAPTMAKRGRGHVVLISSLAGKTATAGSSIYNATKFGLRGFGLALRSELSSKGVGVSIVFPGFVRDAGMFAESGTKLPRGVGTVTPEDVAEGVVSAIERNRGEVDVAPLSLRMGAAFGGLAPEAAGKLSRRLGGDEIAGQLAEGQRSKR